MLLPELSTPSAIVDLDKLHRNLNWMASHAQHLGVSLRPHIKTHKSIELAMLQTQTHGGDPSGITVSTFAEASAFADAGFRDITWAVPIPMSRVRQAVDLSIRIGCLNIVVDHHDTVSALEQCAQSQGTSPNVLLKIDCGNHRAGVDPKSEHAMDLASRIARSSHLRFRGVLAHGGHAYACRTMSEVAQVALQERNETVGFAQRLRSVGIAVETVSVGSTPTMAAAKSLSETSDYTTDCATDCAKGFNATGHGVTEIRPGNYALLDVFQATLGVCSLDDIALSVLSTVIGVYPERDSFVIDAGGLALSMDPGPVRIDADCGFGVVRVHVEEGAGETGFGLLRVRSLSQEHGIVIGLHRVRHLRLGDRVEVLPNHACMTVAMHPQLFAVRRGHGQRTGFGGGGGAVGAVQRWKLVRGWDGGGLGAV